MMKYNFLRFPEGKTKAVTLSYDDGCKDDIRFVETINQYGLKCTFNLVGKKIEKERPLSKAFIQKKFISMGHEIAIHGYNHRAQNKIRSIEGIIEPPPGRLRSPGWWFAYSDISTIRRLIFFASPIDIHEKAVDTGEKAIYNHK